MGDLKYSLLNLHITGNNDKCEHLSKIAHEVGVTRHKTDLSIVDPFRILFNTLFNTIDTSTS